GQRARPRDARETSDRQIELVVRFLLWLTERYRNARVATRWKLLQDIAAHSAQHRGREALAQRIELARTDHFARPVGAHRMRARESPARFEGVLVDPLHD